MTADQRLYRYFLDRVCRPDPKGVEKSMFRLAEELLHLFANRVKPIITLFTDNHAAYPRALFRHGTVHHLIAQKLIVHRHAVGRKFPGKSNPLFAVNYMDRQFRKDIVNYVRGTVNEARNVNNLLDRIGVYRMHHNFVKRYRENQGVGIDLTHGHIAGCNMPWMKRLLEMRFVQRPFVSLLPLTPGEKGLWFRLYNTPLKWSEEYLPKYAYG